MAWNDLTLSDRARMIELAVKSGITDLRTIQEVYNTYAEGGQKKELIKSINARSKANFVSRLKDPKRKYIQNPDGTISTHRMAYVTTDNDAIVYPEIQEIDGELRSLQGEEALESAIERGDTLHMSVPEADWFTRHYKEYYPKGNTFAGGGPKEAEAPVGTDNPFEYARNLYTTNTMSADFARELNDSVIARNFGFSPEAIAYVIGTESGYNVRAKNPTSSARGILQLTKPTLQQMYGTKKGESIYNQYVNNTRKQTDQIHDAMVYLQKRDDNITSNRDDMSAGRLKSNLLAPNSAMTSPMSNAAWASLTAEEQKRLTKGKSTYNDFSTVFNAKYDTFLSDFAAQRPKQKKTKKK